MLFAKKTERQSFALMRVERLKNAPLIFYKFNRVAKSAVRFATQEKPKWVLSSYVAGLCTIYTIVMLHVPMKLDTFQIYDDGLFIHLGQSLAAGKWLGSFSQFTLMKGPGFPAFLAINNLIGIPISLGLALFHCFAITCFVVICHYFIRNYLISAILFMLLLWHPESLESSQSAPRGYLLCPNLASPRINRLGSILPDRNSPSASLRRPHRCRSRMVLANARRRCLACPWTGTHAVLRRI